MVADGVIAAAMVSRQAAGSQWNPPKLTRKTHATGNAITSAQAIRPGQAPPREHLRCSAIHVSATNAIGTATATS